MTIVAHSHDMIVAYDCSSWRMQCCLKETVCAHHSLANLEIRPEDAIDLIVYITTDKRLRQSYRTDGVLYSSIFVMLLFLSTC